MLKSIHLTAVTLAVFGAVSAYSVTVQCHGKAVRQKGTIYPAHSQLIFAMYKDQDQEDGAKISNWIGHVQIHHLVEEGEAADSNVSYYSQFFGKKGDVLLSVKSPRATEYKDADYYRFTKFEASASSFHDGGGMNGYLVVEREALSQDVEQFSAHYIFQSGDHMGGTLDYLCKRD